MAKIRNFVSAASLAAAASVALSTGALADDEASKFGYTLTITGVSDYLFRGVSFTNNDPAVQPYLELTYGKPSLTYYVGVWGSNVKNGVGDPWELDIYAGVRPVCGPLSFDIGVLYYTNPGAHPGKFQPGFGASDLDYVEFKAGGTFAATKELSIGVTGYITPNQGFASAETHTVEGTVAYALPQIGIFTPTVSGLFGYTEAKDNIFGTDIVFDALPGPSGVFNTGVSNYTYWNAGLKLVVDKWFMDFRYWDTDIPQAADQHDYAQSRFVFSAGVALP